MININEEIELFRLFLRASWKIIAPAIGEEERLDWLQTNWEVLVEAALGRRIGMSVWLDVYGEGGEANGASSRILFPQKESTHKVLCRLKGEVNFAKISNFPSNIIGKNLVFEKFVQRTVDGWFEEKPPFEDCVVTLSESELIVSYNSLDFFLSEV